MRYCKQLAIGNYKSESPLLGGDLVVGKAVIREIFTPLERSLRPKGRSFEKIHKNEKRVISVNEYYPFLSLKIKMFYYCKIAVSVPTVLTLRAVIVPPTSYQILSKAEPL